MLTRRYYWLAQKARQLGGLLAALLRTIVRRPRNVVISLVTLVVLTLAYLLGSAVVSIQKAKAEQAAAQSASDVAPLLQITATPVPTASESTTGEATTGADTDGHSHAAGEDGHVHKPGEPAVGVKLPPATPVEIPEPTKPTADTAKPDSVATAWAKAYFSRPDGTWSGWIEWAKPWVAPNLLTFMATDEFNERGAMDGTKAARTLDVRLSPSDGSAGRDTPVRWSRTVDVDVQTSDGRVTTITYIIEANLTQTGWQIVNAEKKSWTVK